MPKERLFSPGHTASSEVIIGKRQMFGVMLSKGSSYVKTVAYLLRKRGIRAALNFVFVKFFVIAGEGSGGAVFYFIGPLIRRFPQLAPYPYNVEIEITLKCNKKCILCEHTYWNEPPVDLSFEDFKRIVDQFPHLKWVNLTGEGDSFLNKDYLKMISYLKSRHVPVFLVDSFDLIDDNVAKQLIELGVEGIYVSFDGATKETYEKIKVGCSFERTLKNIKNFTRLKKEMGSPIPELCFRFVVTNLNIHEMPQYVELVNSLGDRNSLGHGSHVEFVGLLEFKEIKRYNVSEVPREIIEAVMKKQRDMPVLFAHLPTTNPPINQCLSWMEPYIMMGGYVLPCCAVLMSNKREWLRQHSFGNILKKPFKDIWNSERYRKFRQMVNKPDGKVPLFCKGCRALDTTERERKYGVDREV